MGRFYKTASPQMVDFMYKVPEQAILKAIEGTDKQIDTENLYVTDSQKLLQKKALSPDEARQKEKLDAYQKEINDVSQLLASSPLAALKDRQKIRDLGKKIYEDVTRGELSTQYKNYDIRQKHYEEELKRATDKDGTIRTEDLNEAMRIFDEAFAKGDVDEQGNIKRPGGTAYDPTTGTYRTYGTEKLVNYYDRQKEFADIAKDWVPSTDTDYTKEFVKGNYYVTTKDKHEILPLNELTFGVYKTMLSDPKAMSYYNQQIKLKGRGNKELQNKEFTTLFGERVDPGNINSPFKMVEVKDAEGKTLMQKVKKMKDGKEVEEEVPVMQMANPGELFNAAQAAAEKKDKNKIEISETLDATEAYTTALQQQKEIAVAQAKKNMEDEVISIDMKNNQIVTQRLQGDTLKEKRQNLTNAKNGFYEQKNQLRFGYLEGLKRLNIDADKKLKVAENIKTMIDEGRYKDLQKYLNTEGISLPDVSNLANQLEGQKRAIDNNERLLNAQITQIENSDKYKELIKLRDNASTSPLVEKYQKEIDDLYNTYFKNEVSQEVKTIQGSELKNKGIINDEQERSLFRAFKEIKKEPLAIIKGLGQASNAVINRVTKSGVTQSFTTFDDLLSSYGIPLDQTPQETGDGETKELVYTIPGTKEKLALRIDRASLVEGNATNLNVKTAQGKSESVNLGQLPYNFNLSISKTEDGKKVPENVNIMVSRDNIIINAVDKVANDKNVSSVQHVQTEVNKAKSLYQGMTSRNNYYTDPYGVKIYPNTEKTMYEIPGAIVPAYGSEGERLYLNYVQSQK